jgi:hypothetical protein
LISVSWSWSCGWLWLCRSATSEASKQERDDKVLCGPQHRAINKSFKLLARQQGRIFRSYNRNPPPLIIVLQQHTMPSAPVVGALLGVGVQIYTNAVRKLPLMRSPWQHVIAAGAGAAFGSYLVQFEKETEKDLSGEAAAATAASQLPPVILRPVR